MAVKVTSKMTGWDELKKALKEIGGQATRNVIKQAMDSGARKVVEMAKSTTEFKDLTGELRNSIRIRRKKIKATEIGTDVIADSPHAHLIEFGWMQKTATGSRQIPGRYFLTNALLTNQEEITDFIGQEVRRYLDRRLKKLRK